MRSALCVCFVHFVTLTSSIKYGHQAHKESQRTRRLLQTENQ